MSAFFGALSLVGLILAVYLTFLNQGDAYVKYGVAGLLCLLFSVAGLILGVLAKLEEDRFYLFAWIGIVLNLLALVGVGFIVYAGVRGL